VTSKERFKQTLAHKQPDKVVLEFGANGFSSMHVSCIKELRERLGLGGLVKVADPFCMTGIFEDDLIEALGLDVIGFPGPANTFGYANDNWKEWDYFGETVLMPGGFIAEPDGKGGWYTFAQSDPTTKPAGHIPKDGYYFDIEVRTPPVEDEDDLNVEDNLEEYKPISDEALAFYKKAAEDYAGCDKGVCAAFGGTGLGDIAFIPGPSLKDPKGIRGIEDWYMAPLLYPDYVKEVFDRQIDIAIENYKKIYEVVGDAIDVAFICGTDFGTQINTFVSPDTFREMYLPYYKRINDWIHANTSWKTLKHSCGAIEPIIPLLIEAGFDCVNPVQCSAVGMDAQKLKDNYGKDIVFWGGGIDTQQVLPFGTPEEVRKMVLERLDIFSKDGGYVFNAIHSIQKNTPVDNIIAMFDAYKEFNGIK